MLPLLYDFLTSKPQCLRHSVSQETSSENAFPQPLKRDILKQKE